MSNMSQYYTRQKANEGIKIPLSLPSGEATEDYLIIRGIDSDQFRNADARARRQALVISEIDDMAEKSELIRESQLDIIASLVADWSFEEEFNIENVKKFLREAPQISDAIDRVAAKRLLFFAKGSSNL